MELLRGLHHARTEAQFNALWDIALVRDFGRRQRALLEWLTKEYTGRFGKWYLGAARGALNVAPHNQALESFNRVVGVSWLQKKQGVPLCQLLEVRVSCCACSLSRRGHAQRAAALPSPQAC